MKQADLAKLTGAIPHFLAPKTPAQSLESTSTVRALPHGLLEALSLHGMRPDLLHARPRHNHV